MINTIQTKEKKRRGIGSMLNQFGSQILSKNEIPALAAVIEKPAPRETLQQTLNRMTARGASFDVSTHSFEICSPELLTETEKQFIEANRQPILCHLQQSLLVKHLFETKIDAFDEFKFDVAERQSIIGENEPDAEKVYFDVVFDVSKLWFADLLRGEKH